MNIDFKKLRNTDKKNLIKLMNEYLVQRHMPLASAHFTEEDYTKFIQSKENLWEEYGYGPWAFEENGTLMGWGGLQPVGDDVEIAIVLHPKYWGYGKTLYTKIIKYAFETLQLDSIIILFPSSRKHIKGILRLGFVEDGIIEINGKLFHRYRLRTKKYEQKDLKSGD